MNKRAEQKQQSLHKILGVTARRLREEGIKGAAIAKVMNEAGLTHGAFYSHFSNKDELAQAGFQHAIETEQPRWLNAGKKADETFGQRLKRLAAGYLSRRHRDNIGSGCAIGALANDVPNASEGFQATYEQAVQATYQEISEGHPDNEDDAMVFLSLCVGSLLLSRNVSDEALSERILETARKHIERSS